MVGKRPWIEVSAASFAAYAFILTGQEADSGSQVHLKLELMVGGAVSLSLFGPRIYLHNRQAARHWVVLAWVTSNCSLSSRVSGLDRPRDLVVGKSARLAGTVLSN